MNDIYRALEAINTDIEKAQQQRTKIRKRVDAGASHESHLAYADGLVSGLESAKEMVLACRSQPTEYEIDRLFSGIGIVNNKKVEGDE